MTQAASIPNSSSKIKNALPQAAQNELIAFLVWSVLIFVALLLFALNILSDPQSVPPQLQSLGDPVRVFIGSVALAPAFYALWTARALLRILMNPEQAERHNWARFAMVTLYALAMVAAILYLIQTWRVFFGFEALVTGFMNNSGLTLGFVLAYVVFWLGSRLDEESAWRGRLEMIGLGIGGLSLMALLLLSGFIDGILSMLGAYVGPRAQWGAWLATAVALISGALAWRALHRGAFFGETPEQRAAWQGWAMLSPNIIGFGLFFAGPLVLSFYLSFTNSTAGAVPQFIGLDNYGRMLSLEFKIQEDLSIPAQSALSFGYRELATLGLGQSRLVIGALDPIFWQSLRNTIAYALMLLPLAIIPAIGLALILNSSLPGMKFYRAVYFLPSVAAVVGTALIWRWLYDPIIGFFNYFISQFVGFLNSLGIPATDPAIKWLSDPGVVLISVVFLGAWQVVGYNTVLFLAGLQGIPKDMYEAASIDGADRWKQFWHITLPLLRPTTFFVLITTIVTALQVFNEPYALFPSRPLPIQATTSVFYLYTKGFNEFQFGYASAVAWVLFVLIFSITLIQFRLQRSNPYD
ncbi:MAG: sugar ABC transporter permease [Anaerolineae bacterium]|nr:sugar ABC transporter permease [Anaerolineae bacterium]MDW8171963.1 sugar ABC transporter permease [Anaerolineae bacterium]